ncbi:uncharacterized protein MELLADRAFT_115735 [Melampsora larici-populina 98AG31]|uniref:Uncharacterized protein n=1 Tax=Melampsora larici-populina (strain 98AG31 / pathotype 3-4-7) TaxID=747676 RepID=F4RDH2_MELLP|nr:uncharacterized protein MELLADRAFT_115735 [Melampsora larici-populina 98AG31]EGG09402.1 hypothetical protein MELLADRAFT_115735 [Melampsora larici-populina 98AG31]
MDKSSVTTSALHVSNIFDVSNKVAIVTGGGTGIGSMIARTLASNGAKVYIISRRLETLKDCIKSFEKDNMNHIGRLIALKGDVSGKVGVEEIKKKMEEIEPCLDLLINNAGITHKHPLREPKTIESISKAMWAVEEDEAESIYKTNVLGPYYLSAALLPLLGKSKSNPQIINISSVSSFMRSGSNTGLIYPMSKVALNHLTKILATELSGTNVRCNAICPGLFKSQMGDMLESQPELYSRILKDIPAGRSGAEEEMAGAILFLTSRHQSFVNGAIIPVDGSILGVKPGTY